MRKILLLGMLLLLGTSPGWAQETRSVQGRLCWSGQGCQIYYAYAALGAFDVQGKPVIDPASGKQIETTVCLVWKSYYTKLDNPDVALLGSNFYTAYSYKVDPRTKQITIYQVQAPRVVAITKGTGWFPLGGTIAFPVKNMTVQLEPEPKSSWPCSKQVWAFALSLPDREYLPPPTILPTWFKHIKTGEDYARQSCQSHGGQFSTAGGGTCY